MFINQIYWKKLSYVTKTDEIHVNLKRVNYKLYIPVLFFWTVFIFFYDRQKQLVVSTVYK